MKFAGFVFFPLDSSDFRVDRKFNGYYRLARGGVEMYTPERKLSAFLDARGYILEAMVHRGRTRYMLSAGGETRRWLRVPDPRMDRALIGEALRDQALAGAA